MEVIGGIKAELDEIKIETKDSNIVEIGLDDILDDDAFDNDDHSFNNADDPFDVTSYDGDHSFSNDEFFANDDDPFDMNINDDKIEHKNDQIKRRSIQLFNAKTVGDENNISVTDNDFTIEGREKYRCNHCRFITTKRIYVRTHIKYIHRRAGTIKQCPYCPYKARASLKTHLILRHKSENEVDWYRCGQCDYKAKLKSTLARHIGNHMDPNQIMDKMKKCYLCPKMFRHNEDLKKHNKYVHEKNTVSKLKCTECDYECVERRVLTKHKTICHSNLNDLETLKCSQCSYKTKLQYRLRIHVRMTHSKNKLQCEKCAYQSASIEVMKLHMINHKAVKDEEDFKYRCDKCDYKSIRQYSLQIHKLNHLKPEEIQYFYCYHCQFKAKRKDNLKTHVLRHFKQNEVPFQCFICNFNTKKRNVLISHIDKHSENPSETTEQTAKVCSSVSEPSQLIKNLKNKVNPSLDKKLKKKKHFKPDEVDTLSVDKQKNMTDFKTDFVPSVDGPLEGTETTKIISPVSKRSQRIKNRKILVSQSLVKNAKKMKDPVPNETATPAVDGALEETESTKIISPVSKRSKRIEKRKIKVSPSLVKNAKKMKDPVSNETATPAVDGPLEETKSTKIISPVSKRSKRIKKSKNLSESISR